MPAEPLGVAMSPLAPRYLEKPRVSPEGERHVGATLSSVSGRVPKYADGMSGSYLGPTVQ